MSLSLALVVGCKGGSTVKNSEDPAQNPGTSSQESPQDPNGLLSKVGDGSEQNGVGAKPGHSPQTVNSPMSTATTTGRSTGMMTPRRSDPPLPPMPKSDETVSGSYSTKGGMKVEVAAIAKITEDTITCWTPSGDRDKEMEARIQTAISGRNAEYQQQFSFRFGKKNRVVIFKTTMPNRNASMGQGGEYVNISSVGRSMYGGGGYFNLNLNDNQVNQSRPPEPNQSFARYEGRSVAVDKDVSTTSAYLSVSAQFPQTTTLQLKRGATCTLGGVKAKVVSVGPATRDSNSMNMYGGSSGVQRKMWQVEIQVSQVSAKRYINFSNDYTGQVAYFDKNGEPVSNEAYQKIQQEMYSNRSRTGSMNYADMPQPVSFNPASFNSGMVRSSGEMAAPSANAPRTIRYVFNANPKYLSALRVSCTDTKSVELKGIRLH